MSVVLTDNDIIKLFPSKDKTSNKGTFGTLVIIGGSTRYIGAAKLADSGACALRMGSGIVRLAVPNSLVAPLHTHITESTLFPLPEKNGYIDFNESALTEALNKATAVVCGVGLGYNKQLFPLIEWLIKNVSVPLLLDADALNILSNNLDCLYERSGEIVITPHIKEMERLSKINANDIIKDKVNIAKTFADKYNITILLKDYESVISNGKDNIINKTGTPAMAKGGSGDLLSGLIGGLLARNISPLIAAAAGAYIAGKAAELASKFINEYSLLPSETASIATKWLSELLSLSQN